MEVRGGISRKEVEVTPLEFTNRRIETGGGYIHILPYTYISHDRGTQVHFLHTDELETGGRTVRSL